MSERVIAIERMCYGGAGFGRLEGKACFVPFTAAGDLARVRVVRDKRSFLEAELVELLEASPLRETPPCPIFGECGGCDWQHLSYQGQLAQKGEIFGEALRRIGKVPKEAVLPVAPSEKRYGYRSRVQLKLTLRHGELKLGFYRRGSHEVVDAPFGCAIADPQLNRMAAELRALAPRIPGFAEVAGVDLSVGDDGTGIAILHLTGRDPASLVSVIKAAAGELPAVSGLFVRLGAKSRLTKVFGVDSLGYRIPESLLPGFPQLSLRFGRGGFSQVNYPQNLRLIKAVLELAAPTGGQRVLDLFCGNGNISLPVASRGCQVLGVEGYALSVDDARANALANGLANASFEAQDAAAAVRRLAGRGERFDLVILDPPRSGAPEVTDLARLAPPAIVYVSCDPPTLARDLDRLAQAGYRVAASLPVDMFPQTYHLESVTLLRRT